MNFQKLRARIYQELQEMAEAAAFTIEDSEELRLATNLKQQRRLTNTTAVSIHSFYTGTERIFLEIAKQVDRSTPQGMNWHRELLEQMSNAVPGVRDAVIADLNLQANLEELRKFRHVVRSHYAHKLKAVPVLTLAAVIPESYQALKRDLQSFFWSLEQ